ncbi:MAG TPA: PD-(D/E)XK nuclease family protein [Patescibacteria group bacterium]|nr:PD-(D/E)XK nuclease family protein [Patescibacteria group bacterium]
MSQDKYSALWVSHSSIKDFLECPRAYFLGNVYKSPKSRRKIQIISPPLSLGKVVHDVIESLSVLPVERRFDESLVVRFDESWKNVSGMRGGFSSEEVEHRYKQRGKEMIQRVMNHPGPLKNRAVKIRQDLPWYWLSEQDGIILCGRIDWLEYLPESESVHIIDFKTGREKENDGSLQLPIYQLLAMNCQSRPVTKASYWYLGSNDYPQQVTLPDAETSRGELLSIAGRIKLARQLEKFACPTNGCRACRPYEAVLSGRALHVGLDEYGKDLYVIQDELRDEDSADSEIL